MIVIAQWDDWVNLYIDGESVYEGHSLDGNQVLDALNIPYETLHVEGEDAWELCGIKHLNELEEEMERANGS